MITQRIADRLNLYPTDTQEMTINAFGDEKGKLMKVPEYDFCLTGPGDECFYLKGYAVPNICAPIRDQRRDLVALQFEIVRHLIPLNSTRSSSEEIEVLIGADYYWSMMGEDIIRLNERLVLINSKLGYILSGPVHCNAGENDAVNCVHVMKVITQSKIRGDVTFNDETAMNEKVEKFWNLDNLGIIEGEQSIYDKCEEDIKLIKNR